VPFDVGSEPKQSILGGDQFAAGIIQLLLLRLDEAPIGPDGLIDPAGGLLEL
jgi:hypothetical protein